MKITLLSDSSLSVDAAPGMLTIEAPTAEQSYSPYHMVASGLASCTHAILQSWADTVKLDASSLVVRVAWSFVEKPHRVGSYEVTLEWPGLPDERRAQAERVAGLCPVKQTLLHAPALTIAVAGARTEVAA